MADQPIDIASLHAGYLGGASPRDVVEACYARIEAVSDPGIFIHLRNVDDVIAEAEALGSFDPLAKPLWGIPFVAKDNIDVEGIPTTAACPDYAYVPAEDSFVVGQLRAAGALLLGKTNLDQFATGLVGVRSPYPIPRNALDPNIVPGGSSSGSAVAVAQGIASFSLGTDTAGSGRVPAGLNNIVGLKPTLGALSNTGVVPACRTLDTISIFALTVDDAYQVYQVASVFDPKDSYARDIKAPALAPMPSKLTIGVPGPESLEFLGDADQETSFAQSCAELEALGAELIDVDLAPFHDVARKLYSGAWVAERLSVIKSLLKDDANAIHPTTRKVIGIAEDMSAVDAFCDLYRLQELKREIEPVLSAIDLLCVPTFPTFPTLAELEADPITPNAKLGTYTNFVNLLDMCGLAVPMASRRDGRPGGVTLLATKGRDPMLASIGAELHARAAVSMGATGQPLPPFSERISEAGPDEIAVCAVGAHMSGLPLNSHLTGRDGRFLKAVKTASEYRLFKLPGGPPMRPGLVRSADGAAIDVEVWALPVTQFGDFMKTIPAPLGIGTIALEDGSSVQGFLCEEIATLDAQDITDFGGWRAFLKSQPEPG